MAVLDEIRTGVHGALTGAITLDEFEEWFVGRTWDDDSPLVAQINHLLVDRGDVADQELLEDISRLTETIVVPTFVATVKSGSASTNVRKIRTVVTGNRTIKSRLELAGR